jgi:hypothetical protein
MFPVDEHTHGGEGEAETYVRSNAGHFVGITLVEQLPVEDGERIFLLGQIRSLLALPDSIERREGRVVRHIGSSRFHRSAEQRGVKAIKELKALGQ